MLIAAGSLLLVPGISPVAAQEWIRTETIPAPDPATGFTRLVAPQWTRGFYLLQQIDLEVVAISGIGGKVKQRYGGWGSGAQALDMPVDLTAAENSLFVLDQGRPRILRLDAGLNAVSETPLPADYLPIAMVRDGQERFWVAFENRSGLYLFNDAGRLVDIVADDASGEIAILHPALLAASHNSIAVWDPVEQALSLFDASGRRLALFYAHTGTVQRLIWWGADLLILTAESVSRLDRRTGETAAIISMAGLVDLACRAPFLYGLDRSGEVHVFRQSQ